jgi:hypothetical protein
MNCSVTLTAEEFKNLHNALWRLGTLQDPRVEEQVSIIRDALEGAYQQESEVSDRRYAHYSSVREKLGMNAIWSIDEVEDLSERHPFEGVTKIVYKPFGERAVTKQVNGITWAALYVAADAAIWASGDDHHIFIENFSPCADDSQALELSTGS